MNVAATIADNAALRDELAALQQRYAALRQALSESLESERDARAAADDARAELRAYRAALFNFSGAAIEAEIRNRALDWIGSAVAWPTFADAEPPPIEFPAPESEWPE